MATVVAAAQSPTQTDPNTCPYLTALIFHSFVL